MSNFIQEQATIIAEINASLNYLRELSDSDDLSIDGIEYVDGFIDYMLEDLENMELNFYNMGIDNDTVRKIFSLGESMKLEATQDFIEHVAKYI